MALLTCVTETPAATYFISPAGNNSNAGNSVAQPWLSFQYAFSRINCGDTLTLLSGSYTPVNTGLPNINGRLCPAASPLTLRAQNERQAHIHNDGTSTSLVIVNSSYIVIEGLQLSSADNPSVSTDGQAAASYNSSNVIFRRNLFHHNNRYCNCHLLDIQNSHHVLVEENEAYYFHRHAFPSTAVHDSAFRRNYCNSRGYGAIPAGRFNGRGGPGGDDCVVFYPAYNTIAENNICDGDMLKCIELEASGEVPADNNQFLGNISLNGYLGLGVRARGDTNETQPHNITLRDNVVINPIHRAYTFFGMLNGRCDNCTAIGSRTQYGFTVLVEAGGLGSGTYSFFANNSLAVNNALEGFYITLPAWNVSFSNSFGNNPNYYPSMSQDINYTNPVSLDPNLGTCFVWIPDGSPMKKAGVGGKDIGANILYRYQDGVLTSIPLWEQGTGKFPCGAIVLGLNDVSGSSCSDVHKRLNVNANGCAFPASYTQNADTTPPKTPVNVYIY
jgi:hypothetical protein